MNRPVSLTIAVALQWVAAVVAIISGFDLVAAAFSMSGAGIPEQIEAALVNQGILDISGGFVVAGVFMAGILILALAFVRVMVAIYLARGRSWARIVIAVLVGISLVSGVAYLFQGFILRASLTVVVDLVVLWLLFNASSSEYIRQQSTEQADSPA